MPLYQSVRSASLRYLWEMSLSYLVMHLANNLSHWSLFSSYTISISSVELDAKVSIGSPGGCDWQ